MTTLTKRPQTAIIAKAAKYVSVKREREEEDAKVRSAGLLKWPAPAVDKRWSYK